MTTTTTAAGGGGGGATGVGGGGHGETNFSNEEIEHVCAGIVEESVGVGGGGSSIGVGGGGGGDLMHTSMDRSSDDKNIYYNDMKAAAAAAVNVNERFYHDEDRSYTDDEICKFLFCFPPSEFM